MADANKKAALFEEVTLETAHEIAKALEDANVSHSDSLTVHTGNHPDRGQIHVVIPPLGNPILLPLVVRRLDI